MPVILIFIGVAGYYLTSPFNATLSELNTRSILSNIFDFSFGPGSGNIKLEGLTAIIALIGAFIIYCYFFDLIQKKGFAIFSLEGHDSKFSSALPYIFFSALIILYFILSMVQNAFKYNQFETLISLIFLLIFVISLSLYTELMKKALTFEGLKRINEIKLYVSKIPQRNETKDQISFCFAILTLFPMIIFVFSLFTALVWLKLNLNILTLILIECTLIYLSLIYSSISLLPKKMVNVMYETRPPDKDVFILSESKDYYTVLFKNNKIEFVIKDTVSRIIPNPDFDKVNEYKIENPLDEIKDFFSFKNLLFILGFYFVIMALPLFLGAFVFILIAGYDPLIQFFLACFLIILTTLCLRFHNKIIYFSNHFFGKNSSSATK